VKLAEAIGDAIRTHQGRLTIPGVLPAAHVTVRRVEIGNPTSQFRALVVVELKAATYFDRLVKGVRHERWMVADYTDDDGMDVAYALVDVANDGEEVRTSIEAYVGQTVFLDTEVTFCSLPGLFTPPVARRVDLPPVLQFGPRQLKMVVK
jgi:hypothetical protein